MGIIYLLSDQSDLNSGLGTWDMILRKCAHATEYGLLFLLVYRALGWRLLPLAAAIAIGYAATDELHQATVDGRHGTPVDVLIDSAGVAVAVVLSIVLRDRATAMARRLRPRARARVD